MTASQSSASVRRDDRQPASLAEDSLPDALLRGLSVERIIALPSFLSALRSAERLAGGPFERLPLAAQDRLIERRLRQLVEVCRTNPLWRERIDAAIGHGPLASLAAFQAIPPTDKDVARTLYTGDRPGMVVPIDRGGFQIATSGGTASGQPTEIVYPLDELQDTYGWAGAFIGRHIVARHMPADAARWVACTLADHMMWSSGSMVGGVLQTIPGVNYIGAGAIDAHVFGRIMAYPGAKAIMGISRSIADLVGFAEHVPPEHRASLRIALYGSGALQPKVHADLKAAYPNVAILSFFAAMQAEAIGLQRDPRSPVLTAIPGLHLIEIVDGAGRAVRIGEQGDLLVTRLFGNGAPVLRYRLGDRVVRRPDLVSAGLNAIQFEYFGRSGDHFTIAGQRFDAPHVIASVARELLARGIVDLDRVADDVQIRLDHSAGSFGIVATTTDAEALSGRIDPQIVEDAARVGVAQAGHPSARAALETSGYRFALVLVPPGAPELHTTDVGKTPLLVERG